MSRHNIVTHTWLLWLFFAVCTGGMIANSIRLGTNTLFINGAWESKKAALQKGVIGPVAYIVTRPALAGGRLHLGAWNGYQEVIYRRQINPQNITFKFLLEPNGYMTFLFAGKEDNFTGMRFSSNTAYKNMTMQIDPDGKFIGQHIINKSIISSRVWHTVTIEFSKDTYTAYIDRRLYTTGRIAVSAAQTIGFRGSMNDAMVDNIRIRQKGFPDITESFDNVSYFFVSLGIAVPGVFFLSWLCFSLLAKRNTSEKSFGMVVLANIVLFGVAGLVNLYVVLTQSVYVTNPEAISYHGYTSNLDTERMVMTTIARAYSGTRMQGSIRILIIGTSQTWGAGASDEQHTFVRKFERLLNAQQASGAQYEVINAGIPGSASVRLYQVYADSLIQLHPDIVILNLSSNDKGTDSNDFGHAVEDFIRLNSAHNIRTILLLEPNSTEGGLTDLERNHDIMKVIAKDDNVSLIDMQRNLKERYDEGFLWWDSVHLTDFGQELFAQNLYRSFIQLR